MCNLINAFVLRNYQYSIKDWLYIQKTLIMGHYLWLE